MRNYFLFFVCAIVLVALAGCETVKGVGRDITGASSAVQDSFSGNRKIK